MFKCLEKKLGEYLQKRRKEKEEKARKEHPEWFEVSFCLQDVEFMDYDIPFNLTACGNELSLYERDEKTFHGEVGVIFREIVEELTKDYSVMQWLFWSSVEPMPAIKKEQAGEGAVADEHFILKCTEQNVDAVLMELQMGEGNEWQFTEQECYCYEQGLPQFETLADAREYLEEVPCALYIMIDQGHGALMVKTRKETDLKAVENCMRKVCEKYKKEIHDYIGHGQ